MDEASTVDAAVTGRGDAPGDGRRGRVTVLAWSLAALGLLTAVATATLVFLNRSAIRGINEADPIEMVVPIGYAVIGAFVASRRPRNPIGWIFLGIGITTGIPGVATQYVFRSAHFHLLPGNGWVAWSHDVSLALVFPAGLAAIGLLLFPDGRFHSRGGRWLGAVAAAFALTGAVASAFQSKIMLTGSPEVRNPIALPAFRAFWNGLPGSVYWFGGLAIMVLTLAGVFLRVRRSTGERRQQLRWLAYGAFATMVGLVVVVATYLVFPNATNAYFDAVIVLGFGVAIPVSCGIAILKHGLFDLDVVISKTVVYGLLAAFFTAVYVALVVGVGTVVGSTHSTFLTVLAAAVIAIAFNPVRERARHFANHVVYGKRATPYEVLSEFAGRVAGAYEHDDVLPRMAGILGEGTGARGARVWLRIGDELRPAASWGEPGGADRPIATTDGELPAIPDASKVVAVRDRGDLLGALTVTKPPNEPMTGAEAKLVDDLAAQAGLVLRNVRLTEELRANVDELRASRQRIVSATDEARRRLERNIHDGAQQELVALAVKLRLVDGIVGRDDARAHEMLAELQGDAKQAHENLRDLARGIYPPLLADRGLVAALEAQARKSPVPVTVEADRIGRYPQEAEAAVYFCTLEALQNVAKYANATAVAVRLHQEDGLLTFEVSDDGVGFDPGEARHGTGTQGMVDRVAALGGELHVDSAPGRGTRVVGRLPVDGRVVAAAGPID